ISRGETAMDSHMLKSSAAVFVVVSLSLVQARASDPAQPTWNPKAAAKYLDGRAESWLKWSGAARGQATACISCHTTLPYALARPALSVQLREATAGPVEQAVIANVKKRVANWDRIVAEPTGKDPFVPFYAK